MPKEAAFSPDGNWIALVTGVSGEARLHGFLIPFDGLLAEEAQWISVTDESYQLSLHFSPDGNLLYFFNLRDGFRCLWGQRLHPANKRPLGAVFPVHHFHKHQRYPMYGSWISVSNDRLAINLTESLANVWMLDLTEEP